MLYEADYNEIIKVRLINSVAINPPYIHLKRKVNEYIIYVIKKGKMYIKENNVRYVLKQGDFFLLDSDYVHEGYKASECEYYYIHFQYGKLHKLEYNTEEELTLSILSKRNESLKSDPFSYDTNEQERVVFPKYFNFINYNDFIKVCCLLDEAAAHNKNPLDNYKLLCSLKVLEVLLETYRSYAISCTRCLTSKVPKSYSKVHIILNYININYADKITSKTIEEISASNFDYMNRIFKQFTGKTIFSYLNTVRIQQTKEMIATSTMTLSEIGQLAGFSDVYYFSKVFKKATGISPSMYAKGVLK